VALWGAFDKRGALSEGARVTLEKLSEIAAAHSSLPVMAVVHGPGPSADARGELQSWLSQRGLAGAPVEDAGLLLPATVLPVRGSPPPTSRIEFVFVSR
jgi:hypothetical protein